MRLDQKYFIPFMLIVAAFCVIMIIYFNISFMGSQEERFLQRVGDGTEHLEQEYTLFFDEVSLTPAELTGEGPVLILFWASWSARSLEAQEYLIGLVEQSGLDITVISAAVKDDADYIRETIGTVPEDFPFVIVDGTEHYNDVRLPGLPSIIAWNTDGSLFGAQLGFRQTSDYDFLKTLFEIPRNE